MAKLLGYSPPTLHPLILKKDGWISSLWQSRAMSVGWPTAFAQVACMRERKTHSIWEAEGQVLGLCSVLAGAL